MSETSIFGYNLFETAQKANEYKYIVDTDTLKKSQLSIMSIEPNKEAGLEKHEAEQINIVVKGKGIVQINNTFRHISQWDLFVIPSNVSHNIKNMSKEDNLVLQVIYSPPQHSTF